MKGLRRFLRQYPGGAGFAMLALGYIVMGASLVQYLQANNVLRQMDFAIGGGVLGIVFVILGGVTMLVERHYWTALQDDLADCELIGLIESQTMSAQEPTLSSVRPQSGASPIDVRCSEYSVHRPDCIFIQGRADLVERQLDATLLESLVPCRLCLKELA